MMATIPKVNKSEKSSLNMLNNSSSQIQWPATIKVTVPVNRTKPIRKTKVKTMKCYWIRL